MSIRPILEKRSAQPTMEGAGVHLHRAFIHHRLYPLVAIGEHIRYENIVQAIVIDVGHIDTHCREAKV